MVKLKKTVSNFIGVVGVLTILAIVFYQMILRVNNEIGPIGADKSGRQIMLQSMDHYMSKLGINITSEWEDTYFLGRLLVQEPMRTTFRIKVSNDNVDTNNLMDLFFYGQYDRILLQYKSNISIRENYDLSPEEVNNKLQDMKAVTAGDLLSAWGFRRIELIQNGKPFIIKDLRIVGRKNVKWSGS